MSPPDELGDLTVQCTPMLNDGITLILQIYAQNLGCRQKRSIHRRSTQHAMQPGLAGTGSGHVTPLEAEA
jgi:hypothetical protein